MTTHAQYDDTPAAAPKPRQGRLLLFPVPLSEGVPQDVLPRCNIELLRGVKYFAVENLRSARRFIKSCDHGIDIGTLTMAELNDHTDPRDIPAMLAPIERGEDVGVISEAGCPAIADPGADLVAIAQARGYEVVPLVGPSSILLSLMASGFNGQSFAFVGYLPVKSPERERAIKSMLQRIDRERQTQIFIETPYRNNRLLEELQRTVPGNYLLCVAADITGSLQSIKTMPLSKWKSSGCTLPKVPAIFLLFS